MTNVAPLFGSSESAGPLTPLFVTIEETKRLLNLSHGTVYKLLRERKIKAVKHGGKTLVNYESVNNYANSLPAFVSAEAVGQ